MNQSNKHCFLYFLWFWKWFPAEERFPPHAEKAWCHCHCCCYYYRPSYLEHFLPVWAIVHREYLLLLINLALFNLKKKKTNPFSPFDNRSETSSIDSKVFGQQHFGLGSGTLWIGISGSSRGSIILVRIESGQNFCICYLQPPLGADSPRRK